MGDGRGKTGEVRQPRHRPSRQLSVVSCQFPPCPTPFGETEDGRGEATLPPPKWSVVSGQSTQPQVPNPQPPSVVGTDPVPVLAFSGRDGSPINKKNRRDKRRAVCHTTVHRSRQTTPHMRFHSGYTYAPNSTARCQITCHPGRTLSRQ